MKHRAYAPQPNWSFNADATTGHAYGIVMACSGALRASRFALRRRLTRALGVTMNIDEVQYLVEQQLKEITQQDLADRIRELLVQPRCENRQWDYGPEGQRYLCWIVLEHIPSDTAIAYSEGGFAPAYPWGLLFLDPSSSMGMDSQWFVSLEEAMRDSTAWNGENPPGYSAQ